MTVTLPKAPVRDAVEIVAHEPVLVVAAEGDEIAGYSEGVEVKERVRFVVESKTRLPPGSDREFSLTWAVR